MVSGKHFDSTAKSIIFSVWSFLRDARDTNKPIRINALSSDVDIKEVASRMLGISFSSMSKIVSDGLKAESCGEDSTSTKSSMEASVDETSFNMEPLPAIAKISYRKASTELLLSTEDSVPIKRKRFSFGSPGKRGPTTKSKLDKIDDFSKCAIKRMIYNFHLTEKKVFTAVDLRNKILADLDIDICVGTVKTLLKSLGFKWRKTKDNRPLLMERDDIRLRRIKYLRAIRLYRQEKRPIIYMDETYIHATHTKHKAWSDNLNKGYRKAVTNSSKVIIVHAGNEEGFLHNCLLIFEPSKKKDDYHDNMNFKNYNRWVSAQYNIFFITIFYSK